MSIFLKAINDFNISTQAKHHKIVREIVSEAIRMPIQLSPVDTGNFVSNWLLGLDSAVPWCVTGEKNPDRSAAVERLIARIPADAAAHNYNLVNNTSYAQLLEDGYGGRSPGAMIGLTEAAMPSIVNAAIGRNM